MAIGAVEMVVHRQALIGESPVWDDRSGTVLWVDILRGEIHRTDPGAGSDVVTRLGTAVGAVVMRDGHGLVAAAADGFCLVDDLPSPLRGDPIEQRRASDDRAPHRWLWRAAGHAPFTDREPPAQAKAGPAEPLPPNALATRMNDAKCDPAGRLWGGTMTVDRQTGASSLYRLDPDGAVCTMLDGVTLSNGLGWSPDGDTMYYIDTPKRTVDAFDFDMATGTVRRRREVVVLEAGVGNPDGMTVDSHGALWVALAKGSALRRYTPAGRLDVVVPMPVGKVTSCSFGGGDLRTLFVTTACVGLSEQELVSEPLAGAVLAVEVGVPGLPAHRFSG